MSSISDAAFDLEQALQECAREPIHIPGSIQPMGFLLLYDLVENQILAASQNIAEYTGKQPTEVLDQPLSHALGQKAAHLRDSLHKNQPGEDKKVGYKKLYKLSLGTQEYVVFVSGPPHRLLIEMELSKEKSFSFFDFTSNIQESLRWMFSPAEIPIGRVFDLALEELKGITGFDRIMLYKFDKDYNGQVISEALGEMESFKELHFPASDIPEQARRLYLKNWIRLITDVDYEPVPLISNHPELTPIDLTHAAFRSVSRVHLQYLRNMGVATSMSVSIIVDGRLWGLIAMHHPIPLEVSPDKRAAAQYMGQLLSMFIGRHERQQIRERQAFMKSMENDILSRLIEDTDHFYNVLAEKQDELMELCRADGLLLIHQNGIKLLAGASLVENNIELFAGWLQQKIGNKLFYHCDQLQPGDEVKKIFNLPLPGILAVPLLGVASSYLVWFRYEQTSQVKWGGKPQKTVEKTAQGTYRLSPRNSFDSWEELVQGKATPWNTTDVDAAVDIGKSLALLQVRHQQRSHLPTGNESVGVREEYRLRNTERKSNILNEQFKAVVQSSPDALAAVDNNNCFTILNPSYQDMFRKRYGITPDIGDSLADLLSHVPAKLRNVLNFWDRVRRGEITNEENSYRDSEGTEVYTYSSYSKIYNRHGKLEGVLATIRDITKTKETEREVRELYQKYKLLMQSVGPLAWTTTASGAFDRPQPAWEAYTGQHFEEYEGFGWADAVHEDDRKRTQDRWLRCVAEKTFYENDLRIWNIVAHTYENFSVYAVPIMNDDNEVKEWFGVCISIQRLKEQEVRLEAALRALQDSNSDLQHFAYVASHDLQEPLRMVTGYLTLIEKRYNDVLDDRGREFMQFAVDGAYRMKRLIEDLLTYSRVNRQEKLEKVSLDSIFDQICQNFRLKIKETNAHIHSAPLPEVRAIPVQMHQLFTNLLNNALKFVRKDETPVIRLSVIERKLSWQFSFEDNGIGIDPKYAQKVFNIFFRLQSKQKYSGTGLGLAICQRVVSNHGGKIWVDTQYEEGTRFIFTMRKYLENDFT